LQAIIKIDVNKAVLEGADWWRMDVGYCESGSEFFHSIKGGEFLDCLIDY
jgi:hypothetical protein